MEKFSLNGKRTMITGGSRGIGLGYAKAFAECGSHLVLVARTEDTLKKAKGELEPHGIAVTGRARIPTSFLTRPDQMPAGADMPARRLVRGESLSPRGAGEGPQARGTGVGGSPRPGEGQEDRAGRAEPGYALGTMLELHTHESAIRSLSRRRG